MVSAANYLPAVFSLVAVTIPHPAAAAAAAPADAGGGTGYQYGHPVVTVKTATPAVRHYTVRPGDTLSSIARRFAKTADWPSLWWKNKAAVPNPNMVRAGTVLSLPHWGDHGWQAAKAMNAIPRAVVVHHHSHAWSDPVGSFTASTAQAAQQAAAPAGGAAPGGIWGCIAQHESGGNPAENTGNGFYGMYQFTISSWEAVGGGPGLPSSYSAATQLEMAQRLQAQSGWGNWPQTSVMCGAG